MKMDCREEKPHWSVFDGVKSISTSPEDLMADINSAIKSLEHARASAFLHSPVPVPKDENINRKLNYQYDARMADEAYKAGLASMAAGKLDEAVHSLNNALSKISAVAKLQSLISLTSQQHQKSSNRSKWWFGAAFG